jgi:dCMP deaminase
MLGSFALPPSDVDRHPVSGSKTESDRYFLRLAIAERAQSDDPNAKAFPQSAVGAVIVARGRVLSRSANVLPPALKGHHLRVGHGSEPDERYFFIEHAERAAIFKALLAGEDTRGSTIYCTRFPCSDCARSIVWAGIKRAVLASGYGEEVRWIDSQRAAVKLLRHAGVTVRILRDFERI